jgi:hypothetical protein
VGFKAEVFGVDINEPDLIKKLEKLGFIAGIITAAFSPFLGLVCSVRGSLYCRRYCTGDVFKALKDKTALQLNQQFGQNQKGVTLNITRHGSS